MSAWRWSTSCAASSPPSKFTPVPSAVRSISRSPAFRPKSSPSPTESARTESEQREPQARSDARRRGYASALTRLLAQRARTSGYVPFLHAFPTISTRSHFIGDWAFVPDGICSYFGTDLARHRRELAARSRARLQLACRNRQGFYSCASSAQFSVDASNN